MLQVVLWHTPWHLSCERLDNDLIPGLWNFVCDSLSEENYYIFQASKQLMY